MNIFNRILFLKKCFSLLLKDFIQNINIEEEGTVFSIFARKIKRCVNLMKIHIYHLDNVCIYKVQSFTLLSCFQKRILTPTFGHENGTFSDSILKRKMAPQPSLTTKLLYLI